MELRHRRIVPLRQISGSFQARVTPEFDRALSGEGSKNEISLSSTENLATGSACAYAACGLPEVDTHQTRSLAGIRMAPNY